MPYIFSIAVAVQNCVTGISIIEIDRGDYGAITQMQLDYFRGITVGGWLRLKDNLITIKKSIENDDKVYNSYSSK